MQLQHLLSSTRRAIQDYNMIEEGDKIAIGISGGKDSLILALALSQLRRFYPKHFEVMGITVSLGLKPFDLSGVKAYLETLKIPFEVCETVIGQIIFEERQEKNPCSLCSKMRKGALYDYAKQRGCNKIALGHNREDINETLLMSLFYEGRLHTMAPVTYMEQVGLEIIRPLIYTSEKDIRSFTKKEGLPVIKSPCPVDGMTKRESIKELLATLGRENPKIATNVFGAIARSQLEGWENQGGNRHVQLPR
ncbi:tRNA 2-thiocytidine(32) synthetase TtcA [Sporanaerobium hydrogeniformans]|uniref:tRNA 2-thiocytidine(32) synthetase TtcA n=1 Tax=Sporanaerobium hydrogeniformans TaxID=3072179 RepID=A0AC61DDS6_9FIRM|nr:ATP-binding protein [Sporanaerobium hydrogeniformans]PHV70742.1 tRNA 2-thiocytidine(32) synthetase TtcA [Sporanaerobium hydrogeniformans]